MIKKILIYKSETFNARHNQAIEASLMDYANPNTFVLYLWSNDNVVFIGKNQNAYLECDLNLLHSDGGILCRRITGGGAVYHDKGNVNFTFIAPRADYDEPRQFDIIKTALSQLGLDVQKTGRNDITLNGRKFSGNAFYKNSQIGMHHGTILINSNYQKIGKYLSASKLKLISNNVQSVAQRVINLNEVNAAINKDQVMDAIINATITTFFPNGGQVEWLKLDQIKGVDAWQNKLSTTEHLLGDNIYYDARIEHRFDWGMADIRLTINQNKITAVRIYSDTLDTDLVERKEKALLGEDIYNIKSDEAKDILEFLKSQHIN